MAYVGRQAQMTPTMGSAQVQTKEQDKGQVVLSAGISPMAAARWIPAMMTLDMCVSSHRDIQASNSSGRYVNKRPYNIPNMNTPQTLIFLTVDIWSLYTDGTGAVSQPQRPSSRPPERAPVWELRAAMPSTVDEVDIPFCIGTTSTKASRTVSHTPVQK